jgi:hypothetical protein
MKEASIVPKRFAPLGSEMQALNYQGVAMKCTGAEKQ